MAFLSLILTENYSRSPPLWRCVAAGASRGRSLHCHAGAVRVLRSHDSAQRPPVDGAPFSLRRRLWGGRGTFVFTVLFFLIVRAFVLLRKARVQCSARAGSVGVDRPPLSMTHTWVRFLPAWRIFPGFERARRFLISQSGRSAWRRDSPRRSVPGLNRAQRAG